MFKKVIFDSLSQFSNALSPTYVTELGIVTSVMFVLSIKALSAIDSIPSSITTLVALPILLLTSSFTICPLPPIVKVDPSALKL